METGGISRRLVNFAKSIVGGVQGGLPTTCVLTCMIFAAVSGIVSGDYLRYRRHSHSGADQSTAPDQLGCRAAGQPAPSWA